MNFDDLKNEWNADNAEGNPVSEAMLKAKETRTPIDIIRRKNEA